MLIQPDDYRRTGYADFQLKNNGAEIRRLRVRLEAVTVAQGQPDAEIQGAHAKLVDSPAENRVRLFYPGKPAPEVIARLKRSGFRWTPSLGCWQAYRSAMDAARREAGI